MHWKLPADFFFPNRFFWRSSSAEFLQMISDDGLKPLLRQIAHGSEHAFMLARDSDDAPAGIALAGGKTRGALDGEVMRLGRT